ncbi:guanine nucleotide-binding protein subunit alpha-12-like [Amphiura filiformis]|uniref:guanine nucleotide-binding protein subunit alpha-12-like n=1 Tax=Amphiura filiformis TaxID=82378 RepID=UPI003B21B9DE
MPSQQDILYARKATRGITEHIIEIGNKSRTVPFRFVDVGGQRSERVKWYRCFTDVTAIIFLASSSEYDQFLMEDRMTNRMVESVNIFDTIINHKYFQKVAVILFLNKTDLLEEKVDQGVRINKWFQGFKGDPASLGDVQGFILAMYNSRREDQNKSLYHHFTTAVDTGNIKRVFDAVHEIILERNLEATLGQGASDGEGHAPY